MINDDKRVLEHFNNLLDKTKENEKVEVYRQNIKYLVNKLEKYFTQTEQLQELIDEIYQHLEDKESLEQQNKRYRQTIDFLKLKLIDFERYAAMISRITEEKMTKDDTNKLILDIRDTRKALEESE